ncbi:MAG TPA: hypothetical protein VHZ24_10450 [Pirellulales bacterium]|nr:hypothetical protein [Pirellulales bacterium]
MNTISQCLIGCLAATAVVWGAPAYAAMHLVAVAPTLTSAAAQRVPVGDDSPEMQRLKVLDLVKRARKAMEEGKWDEAESLVARAEAFQVRFPLTYFGDTPKKARRDLDRVKPTGAKSASLAKLPSQQFQPAAPEDEDKSAKARRAAMPNTPPAEVTTATEQRITDARGSSARQFLIKGRAELAQHNLTGAAHWCEKAMQLGVPFAENEDAPEKLAADIRRAGGKLSTDAPAGAPESAAATAKSSFPSKPPFSRPLPNAPPAAAAPTPAAMLNRDAWPSNTPTTLSPPATASPRKEIDGLKADAAAAAPRAACDRLLIDARRALAVGDVRRATEALAKAKALDVKYEFHEDSPAKVEGAIAKYADLSQRPAADKNSESYRRRYAELQMQQAEELLRWRDFDEAERLANEAKRHGVAFGPFDANPDNLLKRIGETRHKRATPPVEPLPQRAVVDAAHPAAVANDLAQRKLRALEMVAKARAAINAGDADAAERLAREAEALGVPDSAFGPKDDRAWLVLLQVQKHRRAPAGLPTPPPTNVVQPATALTPIEDAATSGAPIHALYEPQNDRTRNVPASSQQSAPPAQESVVTGQLPTTAQPIGVALFTQGEEALRRHDAKTAAALFREAAAHRQDLDSQMQQRLQDHLQLVSQNAPLPLPPPESNLMNEAAQQQQLKVRQASDEVNRQTALAKKMLESDPKQAAAILEQARVALDKASLDANTRDILMRRIDRNVDEVQKYVESNRARLELDAHNRAVKDEVERDEQVKVEVQDKIAKMVDEFNDLMDQRRYAEAELLAKRAFEVAPKEPVVMQIRRQAAFVRATQNNAEIQELKRDGFVRMEESIERASIPHDDNGSPYLFNKDLREWEALKDRRRKFVERERGSRRSEREIEIEQRLRTPVSLQFKDAPLEEVMKHLAKLANVSIYLDPRGLAEEAVDTSTPITIDVTQEISLKSALSLILEPLHLSYVIKDEVLKITSEQLRDGEVYTVTYNVADLVIPIPNFVPNGRLGLGGALADAQAALNPGGPLASGGIPLASVANPDGALTNAIVDPKILAQVGGGIPLTGFGMGGRGGGATGIPQNIGFGGPGGMGGGVQPDFNSLIELITGTIAPQTWSDVGGAGAVKEFAGNLSLVISQTQEVHEQIAELLEQLRRLQDLQVTIEVRFITLRDQFYEQMGVDFNLAMPTHVSGQQAQTSFAAGTSGPVLSPTASFSSGNSITAGLQGPNTGSPSATAANFSPTFTTDLSVPFSQSGFSVASVQNLSQAAMFGASNLSTLGGGSLGFAILSDLEAYFFITAVQNDDRTNILQAPKVTLFNGQQAFVSDTTQSPFVISVIPVVGDFAAAQQPVIVVLSEGTFLTVQAVVSSDRRFVRLTIVPFFSQIGDVNTFTFTGASNATRQSTSAGPEGASVGSSNSATATSEGTTVQLPQFSFQTVTTTVSVPDGGTVLLGGIKRLYEERRENGVPILNKIPYLNRLFDNVSTGRYTQSLMMMVTPRIIIQEEEEALLGYQPNTP